jgi:NADH-quinone oxidoreductase subunit N
VKSLNIIHQEFLTNAYKFILPELVLLATACLLFVLAIVKPKRASAAALSLLGIMGAMAVAALMTVPSLKATLGWNEVGLFWQTVEGTSYFPRALSPFDPTGPAAFVRWIALATAGLLTLLAYADTRDDNVCEFLACLLVAMAGTSLVARANDLVTLYIALEMISIPTYVMLYLPVQSREGQESAVKYFLLSVLSSAVLLFGFSYLYGLTGTTNLGAIIDCLNDAHKIHVSPMALVAIVLVIAGLGFRITAVPFHFYAPDVYEGGPTGVIAQLAYVPKVAGFIALARILGMLYPPIDQLPFDANGTLIPYFLWILSAVTMTVGNVMALLQTNIKRMLAYSGVAHGGYMLIGFVVASTLPDLETGVVMNQIGLDSVLFYLVAYGLMTVGAFAVLVRLGDHDHPIETIDDLAGLSKTHPTTAATFAILLMSFIGLPLTAGFVGKFLLFIGAFDAPTTGALKSMVRVLAGLAALNAAIGAVYYLRTLGAMYLRSPLKIAEPRRGYAALTVAVICAIGTLALGIYPKPLVEATKMAVPLKDDVSR